MNIWKLLELLLQEEESRRTKTTQIQTGVLKLKKNKLYERVTRRLLKFWEGLAELKELKELGGESMKCVMDFLDKCQHQLAEIPETIPDEEPQLPQ